MCHRNVYTQECVQGSIKDFEFGGLHKVLSGRVLGGGMGVGCWSGGWSGGMAPQENLGFRSSDSRLTLMESER